MPFLTEGVVSRQGFGFPLILVKCCVSEKENAGGMNHKACY